MKYHVFDTMKYSHIIFLIFVFALSSAIGQEKRERESRIKEKDFPQIALSKIEPYLRDARRIRFYQEFDGEKTSFESKFKKGRLFYSVEFDSNGVLEDVEFIIEENDIPENTLEQILQYLDTNFTKERIKKIQQQYPLQENEVTTLKEAFQNLILPYINYELIIASKEEKGFAEYEILFDAKGRFLGSRKSIPQKYDHVLY